MSTSANIRELAGKGLSVSQIAKILNIRYQHAYNVLKRSTSSGDIRTKEHIAPKASQEKPALTTHELARCGFSLSAKWILTPEGRVAAEGKLPKNVGVYAFAQDGVVLYVGLATMGLAKRLYFYGKPGVTQRTSKRINGMIQAVLQSEGSIEIYTATPGDQEWNSLPVHGGAGLELGLIKKFSLPRNIRSAG